MTWPILSVVTFLPSLGALLIALMARGNGGVGKGTARWIALWTTVVTFAVSVLLVTHFDPASAEFQFVEKYDWLGVASYRMVIVGGAMDWTVLKGRISRP